MEEKEILYFFVSLQSFNMKQNLPLFQILASILRTVPALQFPHKLNGIACYSMVYMQNINIAYTKEQDFSAHKKALLLTGRVSKVPDIN